MSFAETMNVQFELDGGNAAVQQQKINIGGWTDKGFDFKAGTGKAWTGTLKGSVSGINWTQIDALTASGQGAIASQYNWVMLDITGAGVLGTGTQLVIAGKDI